MTCREVQWLLPVLEHFDPVCVFSPSYGQNDSWEIGKCPCWSEERSLCALVGASIWVYKCVWLHTILAGALTSLLRKKEASVMQIVICSFSQHSSRTDSVPSPARGIRDEMEIEAQVLSSGADRLVGESGQETGDGGPGWGGLCWRGTQRAHCGATPNAALEREPTESFLEEVTTGLGFEGCI